MRCHQFAVSMLLVSLACLFVSQATEAADPPKNRVVAMYFHRTQRCPTCKKMGAYAEEMAKKRFGKELKAKSVELKFIDFQDQKNIKFTKAYKITGPTLIVARVKDNKVAEYKNLKEIWTKVSDKDAFCKYVQDNIVAYREKQK